MDTVATWSIPYLNDGGPVLALPRELLAHWQGTNGPHVGQDFPFGADYARACEAAYPAELISVGPGTGLVMGAQDHVYPAQWLSLPEMPGIFLVGWSFGDEDSESYLVDHLRTAGPSWARSPRRMTLGDGGLILFHAATDGEGVRELTPYGEGRAVIGDGIPIRLDPGDYAVDLLEVGGDLERDSLGCSVCRWVPLNAATSPM